MGIWKATSWHSLAEFAKLSDAEARSIIETLRWPDGPACPRCNAQDISPQLRGRSHRDGVYKCRACKRHFSVTVGTLMQSSHLGPQRWLKLFVLLCGGKPVSALQLQRELDLQTYGSAWNLAQKLARACKREPLGSLFKAANGILLEPDAPAPDKNPGRRGIQLSLGELTPDVALQAFLHIPMGLLERLPKPSAAITCAKYDP